MGTENNLNNGEPKDQIDEAIRQEIEEYQRRHGEHWCSLLVNNLVAYIPGGYRRGLDPNTREDGETASEKRRSQSFGEFCATIDAVIQEMEISPEEIMEEKRKNSAGKESRFFDYMLELYTRLRKMGYNRYPDLTR